MARVKPAWFENVDPQAVENESAAAQIESGRLRERGRMPIETLLQIGEWRKPPWQIIERSIGGIAWIGVLCAPAQPGFVIERQRPAGRFKIGGERGWRGEARPIERGREQGRNWCHAMALKRIPKSGNRFSDKMRVKTIMSAGSPTRISQRALHAGGAGVHNPLTAFSQFSGHPPESGENCRSRSMRHPLKDYLDNVEDTVPAFARRIGVAPALLQRIIAGEEWPQPALARRIVDAVGGAVPFEALYELHGVVVADFAARRDQHDDLDKDLLAAVMYAAIQSMFGPDEAAAISRRPIEIAAEAASNTYAALARVTTRQALTDRVAQALRPVLEEILKDCAASDCAPDRFDEAACHIAALYARALSERAPE